MSKSELTLRYGCNPHQNPARIAMREGNLPLEVLSGSPGYINMLDALNAWQLVREMKQALGLPAAASFKHVSPAGAAVAVPLSEELAKACFVDDLDLSPVAVAYARARGADPMSSFGDCAAVSETVDVSLAKLLKREVSDILIAPDFEPEAVEILKAKKDGKYALVRIDPAYEPPALETRDVFGMVFEQRRNDAIPSERLLDKVVTKRKTFPAEAKRDLLVATLALKYTQSNSVCYAVDGQVIGLGAGQQSRIHCTRLAGNKADIWRLRLHPRVMGMAFRKGVKRPDRNNAIEQYLQDQMTPAERESWSALYESPPPPLTPDERRAWLDATKGVAVSSDAFFPFRDNIDRAVKSGAEYILQPGGSVRDDLVIEACDEHGMVMAFSGMRWFTH